MKAKEFLRAIFLRESRRDRKYRAGKDVLRKLGPMEEESQYGRYNWFCVRCRRGFYDDDTENASTIRKHHLGSIGHYLACVDSSQRNNQNYGQQVPGEITESLRNEEGSIYVEEEDPAYLPSDTDSDDCDEEKSSQYEDDAMDDDEGVECDPWGKPLKQIEKMFEPVKVGVTDLCNLFREDAKTRTKQHEELMNLIRSTPPPPQPITTGGFIHSQIPPGHGSFVPAPYAQGMTTGPMSGNAMSMIAPQIYGPAGPPQGGMYFPYGNGSQQQQHGQTPGIFIPAPSQDGLLWTPSRYDRDKPKNDWETEPPRGRGEKSSSASSSGAKRTKRGRRS